MDTTTLDAAFEELRPRLPSSVIFPLQKLLGTDPVVYAQAQWLDHNNEQGLQVDIFTNDHHVHARMSKSPRPVTVSVSPLLVGRITWTDDDYALTVADREVKLFTTPSRSFEERPRATTGHPEHFLRWAVEKGTWAQTASRSGDAEAARTQPSDEE